MFQTTTADGAPLMMRVSFWQCVKAGFALSIGASAGAGIGVFLLWATWLGTLGALLSPLLLSR
jgi:hypothetical protein